tara:strand:+ start:735 stop:1286 length:552 start_codon:yes stop_codon:yes gene_type:complete
MTIRNPFQKAPKQKGPRVNKDITVSQVRLLDEAGEMVGVVSIAEALEMAREVGLDLIEVSPNAEPPVCKITDYGKYKFQEQKRLAEARKKQKVVELKELKLGPTIEEHDYQIKMKAAFKFIEAGNKVKFSMRFRGRQIAHKDIGFNLMKRVAEELEGKAKVESHPRLEGRQMIMVVSPDLTKQ